MRFGVICTRARGRVIARRALANKVPLVGDLRIEQLLDTKRGRHMRIARFLDAASAVKPDLLPILHDPVILGMSPLAFTLAGYELVAGVEYGQVWWCRSIETGTGALAPFPSRAKG